WHTQTKTCPICRKQNQSYFQIYLEASPNDQNENNESHIDDDVDDSNVAAAFIISLCIADLLFCALVLPFQGLRFVQGTWRHGAVLCRLIPFIQYGNIGVSLLCIAMITINRYVMITHHGCYARIYKRHWIAVMIAACWLISYGMQLPTLLGAWGRFGYDDRLQTCSIMSDDHGHSSKTTLFITAFVIPCLVIIACYAKIFWVVHKSEQRLKRHANKQNSIPNNLRPVATATSLPTGGNAGDSQTQSQTAAGAGGLPASRVSSDSSSSYSTDVPEAAIATGGKQPAIRVKDQREVRAKRNEWRINKMVLAIFLSFVICYLPITIVKVADKDVDHPSWHIFSYIMLYLSACINPIIYVIMNKQYRKAYKTVVLCQPARLLLPFGKTNGGASSAAEMERYRIEQQPQPHHRLPDVGRRNSNGNGIGIGIGSGNNQHGADIRLPALCIAKVDTIAGANVKGPRSDKQIESADIGYAHINVHAHANDHVPAPPPSVTLGNAAAGSSRMLPLKKNNHSYINNGLNSSGNSNNSSVSQSSAIYRPGAGSMGSGSAPLRRITMVGDDIILEEEELPATPSPTATSPPESPAPPPPQTAAHPLAPNNVAAAAAAMAASKVTKSPIYMNVNSPKRMQSYSDAHIPAKDAVQQDTASASKVQQAAMFPNTKD
ncbi:LOW QUALITY PROTEIN: G-protein coupled receptor moody-like, partial [Drosophila nasuta]|uniref:LOW QUALITY PROTEIN: G-protein coupled receptor moody-like n=1 Tax=Drosophila nasuta TaxID=42062 RepID=UPI00295EEB0C